MNRKEIPQEAIDAVARHINERDNKPTNIPIITIDGNTETPHYFEILPFDQIDNTDIKFFAVFSFKVEYLLINKKNWFNSQSFLFLAFIFY